jgi:ribonuclease J
VGAPSVSFLGGVAEIGGNKVLVEDGPDRVLFDFGPAFSERMKQFYVNYLQPRSTSPVKDLLEFDLLPRVDGLYAREALAESDLAYRSPEVHGVFLSHAHIDHAGYLHLLDPEIPVYLGRGTKALLDLITTSGRRNYGAHDWRIFEDRAPIRIGRLEIVPYPVDHSVPFAYGYLVRTSAGTLVYTGDFRHHGPRAADTHAFLAAAEAEAPIALVTEGTRAGPDPRRNLSEAGVRTGIDRLLADLDRPAFACTYPRDVDRLRTLYAAARAADRTLVVPFRAAHLLASLAPELGPDLPVPGRTDGIAVYGRRKKLYAKWERPFLEEAVPSSEIRAHGRKYLLAIDLLNFPELIDLRPPAGSPFVHSMSEPFSEDDVDDRVLHNWIDHFGLTFHQMHASGHASGPELLEIVRTVAPGTVFPIHTQYPEFFRDGDRPVTLPELGRRFALEGGGRRGR